jgi:serine/threonine-protein kinase
MSPEQADGRPLDHRSDLFSLGAVLYFMATAHPPFRADRPMAVLKRICHDPHRPACQCNAEVPEVLSAIIDRLLEKDPNRRLATAGDLQKALAQVLSDVQSGRIGRRRRSARFTRRMWIGASAAAVVALVAIALIARPLFTNSRGDGDSAGATAGSADGALTEASAESAQATLEELMAVDPSPTAQAVAELEALSGNLESLETYPYPFPEPDTKEPNDEAQ